MLPRWLAHLNKRFFNKAEIKKGIRPLLTHVGRSSGKIYHVPIDAQPVDGGYLFTLRYGSGSDWVKNVLAVGTAQLKVRDEEFELISPRLLTKDATCDLLSGSEGSPVNARGATEFMLMDIIAGASRQQTSPGEGQD